MTVIDRPLMLGELLAETVRLYGERFVAALGLGLPSAGAYLLTELTPDAVDVAILALVFTATYAAAARIVAGDEFAEAWAQVGLRLPTLLVLGLIVAVPFALAFRQLFLLIPAVAWLGLTGFSIPVAMMERDAEATNWFKQLSFTLYRSVGLARVEYLHAVGIAAALVLVQIVLGVVLASALIGFAENGRVVAIAITQAILAPLFFLGLSVLYFEQKARALSSLPKPKN